MNQLVLKRLRVLHIFRSSLPSLNSSWILSASSLVLSANNLSADMDSDCLRLDLRLILVSVYFPLTATFHQQSNRFTYALWISLSLVYTSLCTSWAFGILNILSRSTKTYPRDKVKGRLRYIAMATFSFTEPEYLSGSKNLHSLLQNRKYLSDYGLPFGNFQ